MPTIQNKWIEKEKKKRAIETAPAFAQVKGDDWLPTKINKKVKRHTPAANGTMHKTLRGTRK